MNKKETSVYSAVVSIFWRRLTFTTITTHLHDYTFEILILILAVGPTSHFIKRSEQGLYICVTCITWTIHNVDGYLLSYIKYDMDFSLWSLSIQGTPFPTKYKYIVEFLNKKKYHNIIKSIMRILRDGNHYFLKGLALYIVRGLVI